MSGSLLGGAVSRRGAAVKELEVGMLSVGTSLSEDKGWAEAAHTAISGCENGSDEPTLWSALRRVSRLRQCVAVLVIF